MVSTEQFSSHSSAKKKEERNELNQRKNWEKKEKMKREKRKEKKDKMKRERKKRERKKKREKEKRPVPPTRLLDEEFESETEEDCQEREAKGETHLFIIIFK